MGLLVAAGAILAATGTGDLMTGQPPISPSQAMRFVHDAGDDLFAVLSGFDYGAAKRGKLRALICARMDVRGIAQFSLGHFWRLASEAQRAEYIRRFPDVLAGDIEWMLGTYPGASFSVDRSVQRDAETEVWTTIFIPGTAPRGVAWLVAMIDGGMRIIDVIGDGESLRISQRDGVASFLAAHDHDIDALLETMRHGDVEG